MSQQQDRCGGPARLVCRGPPSSTVLFLRQYHREMLRLVMAAIGCPLVNFGKFVALHYLARLLRILTCATTMQISQSRRRLLQRLPRLRTRGRTTQPQCCCIKRVRSSKGCKRCSTACHSSPWATLVSWQGALCRKNQRLPHRQRVWLQNIACCTMICQHDASRVVKSNAR